MMGTSQMDAVLGVANVFMMLGANLFVQSSLLAGLGLLACWMLRNRGAALRAAILRLTLVAILVCPIVSFGLTKAGVARLVVGLPQASLVPREVAVITEGVPSRIPLRLPEATEVPPEPLTPAPVEPPSVHQAEAPVGPAPEEFIPVLHRAEKSTVPGPLAGLYVVLIGLWSLGSGSLLLRLLIAHIRLVRLRIRANEAPADVHDTCMLLAKDLKVRPPRLLSYHLVKSPCLTGFLRPAILLPEAHGAMHFQALRKVLVHELAHLVKGDCLWSLLSKLMHAMAFFQPLMWLLVRRLEEVADEVADDIVVHHDADRWSYARVLVDIAEQMQPALAEDLAGMGIVHFKSSLGWRLWRILDTTRELSTHITLRKTVLVTVLALCATLAAGLVGASSTFRPDAWAEERLQKAIALREEAEDVTIGILRRQKLGEAMALLTSLVQEYPSLDEYRGELGVTVFEMSLRTGFSNQLRQDLRSEAIEMLEPVSDAYATNTAARSYRHCIARCYSLYGQSLGWPEAAAAHRRAVETSRELVAVEPDNAEWQSYLAVCLFRQVNTLVALRQPHIDALQEGLRHMQRAQQLAIEQGTDDGLSAAYAGCFGDIWHNLGGPVLARVAGELVDQGRSDEAQQLYELWVASIEELALDYPEFYCDVLLVLAEYEALLTGIGDTDKAEHVREDSEDLRRKFAAEYPELLEGRRYQSVSGPTVAFPVRINTPGDYKLFIRSIGLDSDNDELAVWIDELCDGPDGEVPDWYWTWTATRIDDFEPWRWKRYGSESWRWSATGKQEGSRPASLMVWTISQPGDYTVRLCGVEDGTAVDALALVRTDVSPPISYPTMPSSRDSRGVFVESEGRVVVEAENFVSSTEAEYAWVRVSGDAPADAILAEPLGGAYIQALPDSSPSIEEKINEIKEALEWDPDDTPSLHYLYQMHRWCTKEYDDALMYLTRYLELEPDDFKGWQARAKLYNLLGKPEEANADYTKAVETLTKVIELEPENRDALQNRAEAYGALEQYVEAITDWGMLCKLEPENQESLINRAEAYEKLNHYAEAAEDWGRLIELNPTEMGYRIRRGIAFFTSGELDKALADGLKWAELQPTNPDVWLSLGILRAEMGQFDEAVQNLTKSVELDPTKRVSRLNLGAAFFRTGRYDETVAVLQSDLGEGPVAACAGFLLAMAHEKLGHGADARQWFDRAVMWADQPGGNRIWYGPVTLKALRKEAETLFGKTEVASTRS